jgi:hypothetical protein
MNQGNHQGAIAALVVAVAIGVIGFAIALGHGLSARAWEAYLVNFLFWTFIAQGGIAVACSFYLTHARWAGSAMYRIAETFVGFLPISFVLFWALFVGRHVLWVWVDHPLPEKAAWLNVPFFFLRDGVGLLIMTLLSLAFVKLSRRDDVRAWAEDSSNIETPPSAIRRLAIVTAMAYTAIYTMLAFDLIMSMAPRWHSTLFGAWIFATAYWAALVTMALLTIAFQRQLGPDAGERRWGVLHDIGKMVFAFSVFWVYLLFSQYIVIWYGDIPAETFFVVPRVQHLPWGILGWTTLLLMWAVPFCVLMGQRSKRTPAILGTVSVLGLIGVWIDLYLLVVPSVSPKHIPFGWVEVLVSIGFFGLFGLASLPGLRRVSPPVRPATWGGAL